MIETATEVARAAGFGPIEPADALRSIAAMLAPAAATDPPPGWLRDHQLDPFRRGLGTARLRGGAMIALPVGAGKTYLSLAIAAALAPERLIAVTAPAILAAQWHSVASTLGIPIGFVSHEGMSRGRELPPAPVVIVDESHRFREPTAKRYRNLATALRGRRTLLVTATPVVNRLADLRAQLLLAFRDDALRLDGVPSLTEGLDGRDRPPPALGRLIVTGTIPSRETPGRAARPPIRWGDQSAELDRIVREIDRLQLSRDRGIRALVRAAFLRALASSPAALLGSLRRYRGLLAHASDAKRAGFPVNRALIRAAIATDPEQLVFWELLGTDPGPVDLALGDLPRLDRIEEWLGSGGFQDSKLAILRGLLPHGPPTVIFTTAIETVRHIRNGLPSRAVAWLTGSRSGIGGLPATRAAVLAAFDPAAVALGGLAPPRVLVTTDVAAEGLNLQRAGRVIHYDLPWTAVRLDQRDGRAIRLGSLHAEVEIVSFAVPETIESRLALELAVHRKARLAARVGIAADVERALAAERRIALAGDGAVRPGFGATGSGFGLAAFTIEDGAGGAAPLVLGREPGGAWTGDGAVIERAFEVISASHGGSPSDAEAEREIAGLAGAIGAVVAAGNGEALFGRHAGHRSSAAIRSQVERTRRERRWGDLERWERGLRLLGRGRTAGESIVAARLAAGDESALAVLEDGTGSEPPLIRATLVNLVI